MVSFCVPFMQLSAPCAQVPVRWDRMPVTDLRFVRVMQARGIQTHVWTINDSIVMHQLLDLGFEGIMTDFPARLKAVLLERNSWVH